MTSVTLSSVEVDKEKRDAQSAAGTSEGSHYLFSFLYFFRCTHWICSVRPAPTPPPTRPLYILVYKLWKKFAERRNLIVGPEYNPIPRA